jgi:hypothetical protein
MKKGIVKHGAFACIFGFFAGFIVSLAGLVLGSILVHCVSGTDAVLVFRAVAGDIDAATQTLLLLGVGFGGIAVAALGDFGNGRRKFKRILLAILTALVIYAVFLFYGIRAQTFRGGFTAVLFAAAGMLIAFALQIAVRRIFFTVYAFIIGLFMVENRDVYLADTDAQPGEELPDYERFLLELDKTIAVNRRYRRAFGILGIRISNRLALMERFSADGYDLIEKQLIALVRRHARLGENQCLVQKGGIFSIVYANADGAYGALGRFEKLIKAHRFAYRRLAADVTLSYGVAGIDFGSAVHNESTADIRDRLMLRIIDVLSDAEQKQSFSVAYE